MPREGRSRSRRGFYTLPLALADEGDEPLRAAARSIALMSSVQRWLIWLLCAVLIGGNAPPAQSAMRCDRASTPAESSCCAPGSCRCEPVVVVRACGCGAEAPPPRAPSPPAPRHCELAPVESEPTPLPASRDEGEDIAWRAAAPARPVHGGRALHLWLSVFRI